MQNLSRVRKHSTPAQREKILQAYGRSRLPQKEFAAQAGIGVSTLAAWLRKAAVQKAGGSPFVAVPNLFSAAPAPPALVQAGKRKWQNFLHAQKLFHPEWNQKRIEIFAKADQFCGEEATVAAKSALAVATVKILQTLEAQLARYRALITERFKQHPDHGLFASLPGAGPKLALACLTHPMTLWFW